MKKINRTTMMIFALVLSLSVTIGGTLAYFSDHEAASGGATLNLGGKTEMKEGESSKEKDIVITNTGKTNMLVRVGIYGPDEMAAVEFSGDWQYNSKDGMYYYKKVLEPGTDTSASKLKSSMKFNWEGDEPDYEFEVTVVHESAQLLFDEKGNVVTPDGWDEAVVSRIPVPAVPEA